MKKYQPQNTESKIQSFWRKNNYFKYINKGNKTFSMILPPPNVTGELHLGHAWDSYYPDMLIRYKQLIGYESIWYPGIDHAGIATQAKVEKSIFKEEKKNKFDIGREEFLKRVWNWKDKYENNIKKQWDKLGIALDYDKTKFTLDDDVNNLVLNTFIKLYKKNLIYKGKKLINWDPILQTAISNIEIVHVEKNNKLFNLKYKIKDSKQELIISTTRPETIFGDVAIFVNPKDNRYKNIIGKKAINPANGNLLKIIADEYVDINFGTGALKVTPGHDFNDYKLYTKHNLNLINILNKDGTLNKNAGQFEGMKVIDARKKIINKFKKDGILHSIQDYKNSIAISERSGSIIEPMISEQWFLKSSSLAKFAIKSQKTKDKKVDFFPKRFESVYLNWLENMEDWCISRQLWWGHRIPIWYKDKEIKAQLSSPGKGWKQDEDVLDTWFSSALWPIIFSNENVILKSDNKGYLSDSLFTGYDIILFWVSRMIYQCLELKGKPPFKKAIIHGLIRDSNGKKMSKSLGNGINPIEVINKWGSDSLRVFLLGNSTPGQDIKYNETKIKSAWDLNNKLFNVGNLLIHLAKNNKFSREKVKNPSIIDQYAINKINLFKKLLKDNIEEYNLSIIFDEMKKLIFDDIANNYFEFKKQDRNSQLSNSINIFIELLIVLHPLIPLTTETIYQNLKEIINLKDSILLERADENMEISESLKINDLLSAVKIARIANSSPEFTKGDEIEIFIESKRDIDIKFLNKYLKFLSAKVVSYEKKEYFNIGVFPNVGILYSTFNNCKNKSVKKLKEDARLKIEFELERANKFLKNKRFIENADKNLINEEKKKFEFYKNSLILIKK